MTSIQNSFNFAPTSTERHSRHYRTLINCGTGRCFREMSLKNYEKRSAFRLTDSHVSHVFFFVIAQVYLCSAGCRVYKGHLQNKWVIKNFRKPSNGSKFVCIKSSVQFKHNWYPFCRNSKISRNSSLIFVILRTTGDKHPSICRVKHFQRKCQ